MQVSKARDRKRKKQRLETLPAQLSAIDTSNWEERPLKATTTRAKGRTERRSLMLWLTAGEAALASSGILNPRIKYYGSSKNV